MFAISHPKLCPSAIMVRPQRTVAVAGPEVEVKRQDLIDSIAYCGLVCGLCHLREACDGCRNTATLCDRGATCVQRTCCIEHRRRGCWECPDFPCGRDMHAPPHDLRIEAFVSFIRSEGAGALIDCLLNNEARGIHYGKGRDYDGLSGEDEVFELLRRGDSV